MSDKHLLESNRLSWNAATRAHNAHKLDQAAFFRQGGSTLFPEELELLGDLQGKKLLHLQCNAGQDSLSLAMRGARVTGVDLSDEAIQFARGLSADSGIAAEFVHSDVYEYLAQERDFDLIFCSYGALCWLPDLNRWAEGVARQGRRLALIEFHPVLMVFETDWTLRYGYFGAGPIHWETGVGDYVGADLAPSGFQATEPFQNPHPCTEFQWTIGDVVSAVAQAGFKLEQLREYPYTNGWNAFERMRPLGGRRYGPPEGFPSLPLMFGLTAVS